VPNPHPLLVHFPIALFIIAVLCELLSYFLKSQWLGFVALANGIAAALAAFAAVVTGLFAKSLVVSGPAVFVAESHETMGYLVLITAVAFAAIKTYAYLKQTDRLLTTAIAVGLLGVVFTIVAAHEGGELVYRYGIGVDKTVHKPAGQYPYGKPLTAEPDSAADSSKTK
jgi:uncharacterized membrane protein